MILKDKQFDTIKGQVPEDLYNRLMNRKRRIIEEEKQMRINMVKKLCIINNDEELKEVLKGIEPLLRNKKRSILLMGGNYEEVKMEIEKVIITFMTAMPKRNAYTEKTSPAEIVQPEQVIEPKKSAQTKGVAPTMGTSPTYSFV